MAAPSRDEALAAVQALVETTTHQASLLEALSTSVHNAVTTSQPINGQVVLTIAIPTSVHAGLLSWPFPPAS